MEVLYTGQIPIEILEKHIMPSLEWKDLLCLRRVSKSSKEKVQEYIWNHASLAPEIEIDSNNPSRGLEAFVQMGVCTQKLFLNNRMRKHFYQTYTDNAKSFVKNFAPKVIQLRMARSPFYLNAKQKQLLKGFENLMSFSVDMYIFNMSVAYNIPSQFENLQILKFGEVLDIHEICFLTEFENIMERCRLLENISLPKTTSWKFMAKMLDCIRKCVEQRSGQISLNSINFNGFGPNKITVTLERAFANFIRICVSTKIKMSNICVCVLEQLSLEQIDVAACLISANCCKYPCPNIMMELPNLKRLRFNPVSALENGLNPNIRPNWPELATLEIRFEKQNSDLQTRHLVQFLFEGVIYSNLTDLQICCQRGFGLNVTYSLVKKLITSCTNLKKLSLIRCFGASSAVSVSWIKLWGGLARLEELCLVDCFLNEKCFIGSDPQTPAFSNLKISEKLETRNRKTSKQLSRIAEEIPKPTRMEKNPRPLCLVKNVGKRHPLKNLNSRENRNQAVPMVRKDIPSKTIPPLWKSPTEASSVVYVRRKSKLSLWAQKVVAALYGKENFEQSLKKEKPKWKLKFNRMLNRLTYARVPILLQEKIECLRCGKSRRDNTFQTDRRPESYWEQITGHIKSVHLDEEKEDESVRVKVEKNWDQETWEWKPKTKLVPHLPRANKAAHKVNGLVEKPSEQKRGTGTVNSRKKRKYEKMF